MDLKRPRKLDLSKPLLSTKRLSIVVSDTSCSSTSVGKTVQNNTNEERVPFSWEKAAGKPKDLDDHNEEETPRLRLPPCLWNPSNQESVAADEADKDDDHHQDEGCVDDDDDDEDEDGKFDSDVLSDAMEVFSLSEALDIVQKSEKARRKSANEGLRLKLEQDSNNGNESPNYLIKRFLPDATALAASSTLHFSKSMMMDNKICDSSGSYLEAYVASPKGCGLEVLFPWRLKHKLCAMKSPVLPCSCTSMQKLHNQNRTKIWGSARKHCTNYKE